MKKGLVIGGGFAGLTAGYYLKKAGWDVTLLETSDRVGGRVRTDRIDGYTLDTGATQMSSGYGEYLTLCSEVGWSGEMVESSPYIGVFRNERIHAIDGRSMLAGPLSPVITCRSKLKMLNTIRDYVGARPPIDVLDVSRSKAFDVESAEAYAKRRLNDEIYETLVDPLVRCYVMMGARNVTALEWFSTLRNLSGQRLLSLKGGNDRLPRRLAEGLDVRCQARASRVERLDQGVRVSYMSQEGSVVQMEADACVLATRLPEAIDLDAETRSIAGPLADSIRYNRAWVVSLGYRRRPATPVTGVLLPTRKFPEISLLWLEHNKNSDRAPRDHGLFSVYSDELCNDAMLVKSDDELIDFARTFLEGLYPELRGHRDIARVTRWPMAIPNPSPGHYHHVGAMKERLDPRSRIQLAGDYFTCVGQNSAIHYGKRAAQNLLAIHGSYSCADSVSAQPRMRDFERPSGATRASFES